MERIIILLCCFYTSLSWAYDKAIEQCLLLAIEHGESNSTLEAVKDSCRTSTKKSAATTLTDSDIELGSVSKRIKAERASQWNRFVLTAHKQNYFLPFTHTSNINRDAYQFGGDYANEIDNSEAKIQLSVKVPLNQNDIFTTNDGLYFGFTLQSWWQVYNDELSAPFRETNYQPELFYIRGLDWKPFGGNTGLVVGFEHQSNGRTQLLSRSWNRVYVNFLYEKDRYAYSFRPWYRLKEDAKEAPLDAKGDDNPDIKKYMGNFELKTAYRYEKNEFSFLGRNNLQPDNKGAIELGWSFPLTGHLKGYVQYFNGYGENLIDYNISQERIGFGILVTDML